MDIYLKLFLVFVLVHEFMAFFTIYKAILTYNKKKPQKYSTVKFLIFGLISTVVIFLTLFMLVYI